MSEFHEFEAHEAQEEPRLAEGEPRPQGDLDAALAEEWQEPRISESQREGQTVEALRSVEGLQPEAWEGMDVDGRLEALRQAESAVCAIDGRDVPQVTVYDAAPGEYGAYDPEWNTISFSSSSLEHDDVREVVDTLVHEDRHAYQWWAIDHPGVHDDPAEVEAWRQNMSPDNYVPFDILPEDYRQQPIEADAWQFAQRITDRVYGART